MSLDMSYTCLDSYLLHENFISHASSEVTATYQYFLSET